MKIQILHAHQDDYEFTAAGTFEMWKRKLGDELSAKVVICTDGRSGHHFRTREDTGNIRLKEQSASAAIGGFQYDQLIGPNGEVIRDGAFFLTTELLSGFWKSIRDYEPDYLFSPPVPTDPLAGVHNDHAGVAEAVRKVAYLINVPHTFTPEYPADETSSLPCKVPVILNVFDAYMGGANTFDLVVDVEDAFKQICEMSFCHQSQINEWLPWVSGQPLEKPYNLAEWTDLSRQRSEEFKTKFGIKAKGAIEVFTVTAWGSIPNYENLLDDFPNIITSASNLDELKKKIEQF